MRSSAATYVASEKMTKDQKKVAFATIIGTTVEWYDFFIYAAAAGLVLRIYSFHQQVIVSELFWPLQRLGSVFYLGH